VDVGVTTMQTCVGQGFEASQNMPFAELTQVPNWLVLGIVH